MDPEFSPAERRSPGGVRRCAADGPALGREGGVEERGRGNRGFGPEMRGGAPTCSCTKALSRGTRRRMSRYTRRRRQPWLRLRPCPSGRSALPCVTSFNCREAKCAAIVSSQPRLNSCHINRYLMVAAHGEEVKCHPFLCGNFDSPGLLWY